MSIVLYALYIIYMKTTKLIRLRCRSSTSMYMHYNDLDIHIRRSSNSRLGTFSDNCSRGEFHAHLLSFPRTSGSPGCCGGFPPWCHRRHIWDCCMDSSSRKNKATLNGNIGETSRLKMFDLELTPALSSQTEQSRSTGLCN